MRPDQTETVSLGAALEDVRPGSDSVAREHARSRLGAALFGEPLEPVQVGRFVLLERLGQGGMGVVYGAYDPKLDRRVALKLLHARAGHGERGHARLVGEARALARLSHPNVVPVHDVGVIGDKVFLVMEHVAGRTLRAWAAETSRSWREVLAAYAQAGRGLAAAHAVGIVHRDFKPDNALMGDDGRVRVVDFGLARHRPGEDMSRQEDAQDAGQHAPERPREPAGAAPMQSGTPAYMAPEQFAGAAVGPAADQFSFCVALYEGLYGQKPFEGVSMAELADNMRAGRLRELPRESRVPAWVHAALCRGLAPDAGERHAGMNALVAELSRDPDRTRRRWLVAITIAALVAVAIYSFARGHAGVVEVCQGGPAELARTWNQERRDRVAHALRSTGRAYADTIAPRVLSGLDRYGEAWTAMRHEACMSHQRGEQSSDMLDWRMRCLDGRLLALDQALAVIEEIDARSLGHVAQIVEGLPSIPYCADAEAFAAEVPPPGDPALAARVEELRSRLRRVDALERAGRYPEALAAARAMASEAEALQYGPVEAEALLAEGRSAMMIRPAAFADAIAPLRRAAEIGIEHHVWALAVEALARRFYVQALLAENPAEIQGLIPVAVAMSKQVADRGFARTLLLNNIGAVYMAQGDRERARRYFEQALEELERAPEVALELTHVRRNLAMLTPDAAQRTSLLQQELDRLELKLGESHPWALDLRLAYAHYTPDPERARALLAPACEMYQRFHGEQLGAWISCLYYLGFLSAELGDHENAARMLAHAATLGASESVTETFAWEDLARGYSSYYRGEHEDACEALRAVRDRLSTKTTEWWLEQRVAHARLGLGLIEQALGRHRLAIPELEAAVATFEDLRERNQDVEHEQRLALAQVALARSLRELGPPQMARACELLTRAQGWYSETGGSYAPRARELANQLEACASPP
jgi:tetratricopeptide (TPR) repeat protein/predicted Ser/Thr protein kinase